jgi:hypothetical protein
MRSLYIFSWIVALVMSAAFGMAGTLIAAPSGLRPQGLPLAQSFITPVACGYDGYRCVRRCWKDDYGQRRCKRKCYPCY